MSESPRFFHFSYLGPYIDETPRIHEIRDGDAFAELSAALHLQGYKYEGLILNYPQPDFTDLPELKPTDLLVLSTRPPIDDDKEYDKKPIDKSKTALEEKIINSLKSFFKSCSRGRVVIKEEFAKFLTFRDRSEIEFRIFENDEFGKYDHYKARYRRHRDTYAGRRQKGHEWHKPEDKIVTATYLVLTQIENGPMLLNAFGMSGQLTLIWCYLLRTKFPDLLTSPKFVMAEIKTAPKPQKPATLSFSDNWEIDLLLNHPLPKTDKGLEFIVN